MIRLLFISALSMFLVGCETLPAATAKDSHGCGFDQWNQEFVNAQLISVDWSGGCSGGRMDGEGKLVAKLRNGSTVQYDGWMREGRFDTTYLEGLLPPHRLLYRPPATLTFEPQMERYQATFFEGDPISGQYYINGKLAGSGEFDGYNLKQGEIYLSTGEKIIGEFIKSRKRTAANGEGVINGKYVRADNTPIWWIVNEKVIKTEREYNKLTQEQQAVKMAQLQKKYDESVQKLHENDAKNKELIEQVNREDAEFMRGLVSAGTQIAVKNAEDRQRRKQQATAQQSAENLQSSQQVIYNSSQPKPTITISSPGTETRSSETNANEPSFDGERAKRLVGEPGKGLPPPAANSVPQNSQQQATAPADNQGTNAAHCISFGDRPAGFGILNNCNEKVWVSFCVLNPKSSYECPSHGGLVTISGGNYSWIPFYKSEGRGEIIFAACAHPASPTNWNKTREGTYGCK